MNITEQKSNTGFTLIEALLAVLMLSFIGVGVLQLFTQLSVANSKSILSTVALSLCQEKMEIISNDRLRLDYSGITSVRYPAETITQSGVSYVRSVAITEVAATDFSTASVGSGIKKIEVFVRLSSESNSAAKLTGMVASY